MEVELFYEPDYNVTNGISLNEIIEYYNNLCQQ